MFALPSQCPSHVATTDGVRSSTWRRLAACIQRAPTCFVGIDIGSDRVEVSRFDIEANDSKDPSWQWASQFSFELRQPGKDFETEGWVERVANQLVELLPRCVDQAKPVTCISIPPSWIHYQTTTVEELEQTQQQCDQIFGSSLFRSEAHLAHWPIQDNPAHLQVAAVSRMAATRLAHAVASVGYEVRSMIPPVSAILNSAHALTGMRPEAVILLDPLTANIAVNSEGQTGLCRSLSAPESVRDYSTCGEMELTAWLETIATEFHCTMRFASRLGYDGLAQEPIMIAGRYAEYPGITETIARLTNRPTAAWGTHFPQRPRTVSPCRKRDASRALSVSLAHASYCMSITEDGR